MSIRRAASLAFVSVVGACGAPSAAPSRPITATPPASAPAAGTTAEPTDDPVPPLRTGSLPPIDVPGVIELHVQARHVANGYETLGCDASPSMAAEHVTVTVDATAGQPVPFAFVGSAPSSAHATAPWLWVRRPVSDGDVTGDAYTNATGEPGKHLRFHVGAIRSHASNPAALLDWLDALGEWLGGRGFRTDWSNWSMQRIQLIAQSLRPSKPSKKGKPTARVRPRPLRPIPRDELTGFVETTTGMTAVQEALQSDRPLWYAGAGSKATVPLASLTPPPLKHHPWQAMAAKLDPAPAEPLAGDVPAEFYYVRASGVTALLSLLDQLDAWGTAGGRMIREEAIDENLAARYETELALEPGPLTRALGPSVVGEIALVGSDPYVEEGTDLTMLMRVKDPALLEAGLVATQTEVEKDHGPLAHSTRDHAGVTVQVAQSADGAVRQQRASVGDVALVSNSPHALDAVIDAIQGKHPRLGDEPDFRFMLARDAREHADVLAFLGDRFVGEVVGPRQKVLERRRQDALNDMVQLGYAALLYGVVQGKSPTKTTDLLGTGLLSDDDLVHPGGEAIVWSPGNAPHSSWGSPGALVPLIDLPTPDRVSPQEKGAYDRFGQGYEQDWSFYIDPVAARATFADSGRGQTVTMSLRELPLIDRSKYGDLIDFVGTARFATRTSGGGLRLVAGISRDSDIRREFMRDLHGFAADSIALDWIGDWAAVGCADRANVAQAALALDGDKLPQKPDPKKDDGDLDVGKIAALPLYAEIAVKSPAQAALALAAARVLASQAIPDMFDWGEVGRHRGVPIVRVALKGDAAKGLVDTSTEIDVFYAISGGALIVTTTQWLIERLVDERLDGGGVVPADAGAPAQIAFDLASAPGKGLWTALAWELEEHAVSDGWTSARDAEGLLRGAPELAADPAALKALALRYFGASPVTPDGASYLLAKEGVRDPVRGSSYAPTWPDVPVAGSPVERVMRALAALHTSVSFEDEGKDGDTTMRSLHAVASFDVRK